MVEDGQANQILAMIKSASMTDKLKAIQEAQGFYNKLFTPEDSIPDYAKKVLFIENLYNLIREELKQPLIKITKRDIEKATSPSKTPSSKKKPVKKPRVQRAEFDFAGATERFKNFLENK